MNLKKKEITPNQKQVNIKKPIMLKTQSHFKESNFSFLGNFILNIVWLISLKFYHFY